MTYEVQFQVGTAEYTVRGPDIDGVLRLIQGVQGVGRVPEPSHDPHAELRKTWAPGQRWQTRIFRNGVWGEWSDAISSGPLWLPQQEYRRHPDDTPWYPDDSGDWVEWPGGDCPVSKHTRVDILCESERALQSFHPQGFEDDIYCWSAGATDRIVAYKVVKP